MLDKNWEITKDKYYEHINPDTYYDPLPFRAGPDFFRIFVENEIPLKNL